MPFGLFGRTAKANVTVEPDKRTYMLGDHIEVKVTLSGEENIEVKEASVELACLGYYNVKGAASASPQMVAYGGTGGLTAAFLEARGRRGTIDHAQVKTIVDRGSTVRAGVPRTYRASIDIPTDMPPTYAGNIINIAWVVRLVGKAKKAKDIVKEVEIAVLSPPPTLLAPEGEAKVVSTSSYDDCALSLSLSRTQIAPRETLSGELEVRPQADFTATEVRADLTSVEVATTREGGGRHGTPQQRLDLAGQTDFARGITRRFSFNFTLPANAQSSVYTPCASHIWLVMASLMRKDSFPCKVEQQIEVYAPTSAF